MIALLIAASLKGTALLAAAFLITLALRRSSADLRHKIWSAALIAMALLLIPVGMPQPVRIVAQATATTAHASLAASRAIPILPTIWAIGCGLLLLRFCIGVLRLAKISRSAVPNRGTLESNAIGTPLTWGALSPKIILPAYMSEWTDRERDVVILHEFAHIERQDWLWQSFAQVMTAIFWFHPLVWFAAAQLRGEAERAADDSVLASGIAAPDYADRLMDVARRLTGHSPAPAVTMVRKHELTSRIHAILDSTRSRGSSSRRSRFAIVLMAAALIVPLAAYQATTPYKIGNGVTPPIPITRPEPIYTEEARKAKIQGTVRLSCVVNRYGETEQITVSRSLDPGLDAAAATALSQWKFKPAQKDGENVDVTAFIDIGFHLL